GGKLVKRARGFLKSQRALERVLPSPDDSFFQCRLFFSREKKSAKGKYNQKSPQAFFPYIS
ncbi:MAG: hypothetical protein IJS78_06835, partial [Clostridia bacterium]|nr:hypothetical protein [Clostridia bacterium]